MLLAVLGGPGGRPLPPGNTRDHLAALVVERGAPQAVVDFARAEMLTGSVDPVYYGLARRTDAQTDPILWRLLEARELPVCLAAVRVAGLLRRVDILEEFERRNSPSTNPAVPEALEKARALARRD